MTSRKLNEPQLKELRELLDVCDDLRKIFGSMGQEHSLTIPEIVVVGNQSVGKSSLLELLSGFRLPSGTGIVTRCPIVLQLVSGRLRNSLRQKQWWTKYTNPKFPKAKILKIEITILIK